jgi:hypothetical protein
VDRSGGSSLSFESMLKMEGMTASKRRSATCYLKPECIIVTTMKSRTIHVDPFTRNHSTG